MIPFLIGLSCFGAAWRALAPGRARAATNTAERSGLRGAVFVGIIAALTLLQLWVRRDDVARYRFSLVGLRYALADDQGRAAATPLRVSGDYDEADLYVPGAGPADVARLRGVADSSDAVLIDFPSDAGAIALVEERLPLGRSRWRIPSAVRMHPGDTLVIRARGEVHRITLRTLPDTLAIASLRIPLPWAARHALLKESVDGPPSEVILPSSGVSLAHRIRGARPSFFARSYPLADVVQALDTAAVWGLPPLTSFFFYEGDALFLADVDSEVEILPSDGAAAAGTQLPRFERGARAGQRLLIAALPLRDYPELRLTLPERYGIRPLRSYSLVMRGEWLDATFATPEVQALERAALEAISLPGASDEAAFRIRVSHARDPQIRQAVVFESPARVFAASSQAVLSLDRDPRTRRYEIVTPAGLATARTGEPVPLGGRERSILLRVDGQATSSGFWLAHVALFTLAGCVFYFRRPPAPVYALAIAAVGFCAIRLLLGISALLEYPFVQEAHQIGLWLLPLLPWAIVVAAEASRGRSIERVWFHVLYTLALITLTIALFADSTAKQAVLSVVPAALLSLVLWRGGHRPRLRSPKNAARRRVAARGRLRAVIARAPDFGWGWSLGLALLMFRMLLDLFGWREGIMLGGTRIAVSVAYTPLALAAFAFIVHRHSIVINRALHGHAEARNRGELGDSAALREVMVRAHGRAIVFGLSDVLAFLVFAFAAVAFWISDFGMLLVGVPGALLLLALLGARWTHGVGHAASAVFALPLVLFVLAQSAPGVLRPVWRGNAAAEARMGEWNRNELLLLERGDPHALRRIGQRRSEALAVMRETMRSYTRGNWFGKGFLAGRVSNEIQDTATREHVVSALLASQWGAAGAVGLVLLLLALPLPLGAMPALLSAAPAARRTARAGLVLFMVLYLAGNILPTPYGAVFALLVSAALVLTFAAPFYSENRSHSHEHAVSVEGGPPIVTLQAAIATLFLLTVACAGLYMVLANYGLTFFTGKNVYLLGLDSVSDALEGLILLAGGAAALVYGQQAPDQRARIPSRGARMGAAGARQLVPAGPNQTNVVPGVDP